MTDQGKLSDQIREFSKKKVYWGILLILLGLAGLILPVLPGIALIILGIYFLKPLLGKRYKK